VVTSTAADGSQYTVTTAAADLVVSNGPAPGSVINISARAFVGSGSNIVIGGFNIVGSTLRTILIQAGGPVLEQEGVTGAPQTPVLSLLDSTGKTIYFNTGWDADGNSVLLLAAAASTASPSFRRGQGTRNSW
jgi:hypothetical protein